MTIGVFIAFFLIGTRIYEFIAFQSYIRNSYSPNFDFETAFIYAPNPDLTQVILIAINIVILFVLLLAVGSLAAYQLYLGSYNMTTIESYEYDRLRNMHISAKFPWDIGVYRNFKSLFGDLWAFWWLPKSATIDGINWERNENSESEWPPKEYYLKKKGIVQDGEYVFKEITAEERESMIYDSDVSYVSSDDEPLEFVQNKFKNQ